MKSILAAVLTVLAVAAGVCAAQTTPVVVQKTTSCATSVDGSVVGLLNPLQAPVLAPIYSGTLPAGTYYVEIAWYDAAGHVTLASPEVAVILSSTGAVQVNPPASGMPTAAAGIRVYIGTTSGGETLQGNTIGSAVFTQSTPLVAGTGLPTQNTTACQQIANDAGWPTGTGYNVSLTDKNGNTLPGYPMQWQLLGPGTTIPLNQGLPLYNGTVTYPVPILARPYNHAGQSISGPLSMTGYNLTQVGRLGIGTSTPGWGVDAEALPNNPLMGMINASNGYLLNGNGGTAGQCLASDGTAFDTEVSCLTSLPTLYYQTVDANGTAQTQRPALNFGNRFVLTDSASPARTTVALNAPGSGLLVATYSSNPIGSTNCAAFDGAGNVVPSSASTCAGPTTPRTCNANGCYRIDSDGTIQIWGQTAATSGSAKAQNLAATFPVSFTTTTNLRISLGGVFNPAGDGNPHPASCFVNTAAAPITTYGFTATAAISVQANSGGSGYDHLVDGSYCSYYAIGN